MSESLDMPGTHESRAWRNQTPQSQVERSYKLIDSRAPQPSGSGLAGLALSSLLAQDAQGASKAVLIEPNAPHHGAKTKSVIWLLMEGGPSHIDLFNPKPARINLNGQPMPARRRRAVDSPYRVHDIHALGLDHECLTDQHNVRSEHPAIASGKLIKELFA
ncbi:MAG TPA: DUF1501 domain-containing protein [Bryobacteraceae bacterium]|nr:DUF1501 domain-containing protein [Bryobacteraceae bacterium]